MLIFFMHLRIYTIFASWHFEKFKGFNTPIAQEQHAKKF